MSSEELNQSNQSLAVTKIVTDCLEEAKSICAGKFPSQRIYGRMFDDLFQDSIMAVLEYFNKQIENDEDLQSKLNRSYIVNSIYKNFCSVVQKASRKQNCKQRNQNSVSIKYYTDLSSYDVERKDLREVINSLSKKCKAIVLMRWRDGLTVEEVCDKLNINKRKYYSARKGIKKFFEKNGYEEEWKRINI